VKASTVDRVTYTTALPPRGPRTMPAQSWGKTRGQETVWGAVGYQISLSASDSSASAGSALRRVAASSGWKVGSGAASSWLGWEAADPIVIPYLLSDVPGGRIKTVVAEIQERLRNFLREGLLILSCSHLSRPSPGALLGPDSDRRTGSNPLYPCCS
jgi:hypothetical protein